MTGISRQWHNGEVSVSGKTILLANELGDGIGYSLRCLALARSLSGHGHRPVVALRRIDVAERLADQPRIPVVQAPYVIGRLSARQRRAGFHPTSFTDLMACNGFGSIDHLYPLLRAWRDLIDLVRPDLIVGSYCPLLTTAAYGRIPVVLFGSGYSTPPADAPEFPLFRTDTGDVDTERVNGARLLEVIQQVQSRFGAPLPMHLTDVYRAQQRFVISFPELDPYRECRHDPCLGTFESLASPSPATGAGFYAYLAGDGRLTRRIASLLATSGVPGSLHVRDADPREWRMSRSADVSVLPAAPLLEQAVREASVVIHHGGLATAQVALALGRPQVIVPRYVDQVLVGEALADQPFVSVLGADGSAEDLLAAVRSLCRSAPARRAAMDHATALHARGLQGARQHLVAACLHELGETVS
ncbi:MAG: hypothetical protein KDK91_01815 [Gammaproteobacteria bacterium]|nr:hypothetical protein [Gammaproteobacteria bacterium]